MGYTLKKSVVSEIHRTFEPVDHEYVVSKLSLTELVWEEIAPPPRVHIAVIWLADGSRIKFDVELARAVQDWRNSLVFAGLENGDWKQVLDDQGIDCDDW